MALAMTKADLLDGLRRGTLTERSARWWLESAQHEIRATAPEPRRLDWRTDFTAAGPTEEPGDPESWGWSAIFSQYDTDTGSGPMPRRYMPGPSEQRDRPVVGWDGYVAAGTGDAEDDRDYRRLFG